jgi:hypothetical protein
MLPLTWKCHICHEERPDALVGVRKTIVNVDAGITLTQNVRYCLDKPSCVETSKTFSFFDKEQTYETHEDR